MSAALTAYLGSKIVDAVFERGTEAIWNEIAGKRKALAQEVIVKELKRGRTWAIADDAAASAMFTYIRAAQEGAARLNLELMAEALTNAAQEATFAPDEFKRHADKLASLSREEVIVLAEFIREQNQELDASGNPAIQSGFYNRVIEGLKRRAALFPDHATIMGYCAALTRTGWLTVNSGYGVGGYIPTPQLRVIERLVEWSSAAERAAHQSVEDQTPQ